MHPAVRGAFRHLLPALIVHLVMRRQPRVSRVSCSAQQVGDARLWFPILEWRCGSDAEWVRVARASRLRWRPQGRRLAVPAGWDARRYAAAEVGCFAVCGSIGCITVSHHVQHPLMRPSLGVRVLVGKVVEDGAVLWVRTEHGRLGRERLGERLHNSGLASAPFHFGGFPQISAERGKRRPKTQEHVSTLGEQEKRQAVTTKHESKALRRPSAGRAALSQHAAMHLMFYLDEAGKRIYTLKVRIVSRRSLWPGAPTAFAIAAATDRSICLSVRAEGHAQRHADCVGPPRPLLARRQILQAPLDMQEALQAVADAESSGTVVMRTLHMRVCVSTSRVFVSQ